MISPTVHDPTNPLRNQDRVESSGSSHLRASDQRRHAVKVVHEHGDMVLQNPVGLSHGSMHGSRPIYFYGLRYRSRRTKPHRVEQPGLGRSCKGARCSADPG